jgi:hypothetical protein
VIDTTVQPKAVMFPTDAKLLNRARERLVRLAKKLGGRSTSGSWGRLLIFEGAPSPMPRRRSLVRPRSP